MIRDDRIRLVQTDGSSVSAILSSSDGKVTTWTLVYAPGAGSTLDDPFGRFVAQVLPDQGFDVLRFQFPYSEEHRHLPDRPPVLEATWRAAIQFAQARGHAVLASGRSMGGRIASQVAAQQTAGVDGLVLFAYPLHPPGKPDQRRDGHLRSIRVPTLWCSGTKDTFATPDELADAASLVERSTMHLLEGADHGFAVAKRTGRTREDVWKECIAALLAWLAGWKVQPNPVG